MNTFHGFTVEHKIGAGGMSTVYMGHHGTLGYPVAVKILHPGMSGEKEFIARFEREARAASSLNHTNIVNVIDFGSENDVFFIVMPYVDGADLGKIFDEVVTQREGALFPLEIALPLLEEVAYGLKAAHKHGIIHRDIKPSNVMFSSNGHVKLADFGLARDEGDVGMNADPELTMPGRVVGTPSYMSPEQAAGSKVDTRTDIFSLGVMAYQLIVGNKPFVGDSALKVQEQIINAELPSVDAESCPRFTPEIGQLLSKMLAKDPAHRFQSMDQVLRALTAAQESIDPSGGVLKYKREYLTRFAEAPVAFADELHAMAVSGYLKRGYHFKNLGQSSIGDAVREFGHVLSLDSDHDKAQAELQQLRQQAEESGISLAAGHALRDESSAAAAESREPEMTLVPAPDTPRRDSDPANEVAAEPEPEPAGPSSRQPAGGNRIRFFIGAAVVLVAVAAVMLWPRGDGGETGTADRPAAVEATEVAQTPSAADEDDGNEQDSSADAATAREAKAAMEIARGDLSSSDVREYQTAAGSFDQAEQAADRATVALNEARYPAATADFEEAGRLYTDAVRSLDEEKVAQNQATAAARELDGLREAAVAARDEMERTRRAADDAGGETTTMTLYTEAGETVLRAEREFAKGDADGFRQASRLYARASRGFDEAESLLAARAASTRNLRKSRAELALDTMAGAKDGLAEYDAELRNRSALFLDAELAAIDGDGAFAQGNYEEAQVRYEKAAKLYIESETELRQMLIDERKRVAEAEINGLVDSFFSSVENRDYNQIAAPVRDFLDQNENWQKVINNTESLDGVAREITLSDDVESATASLHGVLTYGSGGRKNAGSFKINFTWNLESVGREWKIVAVQSSNE